MSLDQLVCSKCGNIACSGPAGDPKTIDEVFRASKWGACGSSVRLEAATGYDHARGREPGEPATLCRCGHPRPLHRPAIGRMDDGCNYEEAGNGQGGAGDFCSGKRSWRGTAQARPAP